MLIHVCNFSFLSKTQQEIMDCTYKQLNDESRDYEDYAKVDEFRISLDQSVYSDSDVSYIIKKADRFTERPSLLLSN